MARISSGVVARTCAEADEERAVEAQIAPLVLRDERGVDVEALGDFDLTEAAALADLLQPRSERLVVGHGDHLGRPGDLLPHGTECKEAARSAIDSQRYLASNKTA